MNKKIILPVILTSFLVVGCGEPGPATEEKKLLAPTLVLNDDKNGLDWEEADGAKAADHFEVSVNGGNAITATSYAFSEDVGEYSVRVRSVDANGNTSDYSEAFTYTTANTALGNLNYSNSVITWESAECAYLEYKYNNGEFASLEENATSFAPFKDGIYCLRTVAGWNESKATYYVDANSQIQKGIIVCGVAMVPYIVEDQSAEDDLTLQEGYTIEKYDSSNAWVPSSATMKFVDEGSEIFGHKTIQLQTWHHGAWFKFGKSANFEGIFNTVEFAAKGTKGDEKMIISFEMIDDCFIGNLNLKGSYIKYEVQLATGWKKYQISMNDENWKIRYNGIGNDQSAESVISQLNGYGFKVDNLAQLVVLCDSVQVRVNAPSDAQGTMAYTYFCDVALKNTEITATTVEEFASLKEKYSIDGCDVVGGSILFNEKRTTANVSGTYASNNFWFQAKVTLDHKQLTLFDETSETTVVLTTNDFGETYEFVSGTGTYASILNGMSLIKFAPATITKFDDFESYASTGTGYDKNHNSTEGRSGLRAAYFSDYYAGDGNRDDLGGNGWSLMGSTDYLNLSTTEAHTGNNSAKCKITQWNAMRMVSWGLFDGTASAVPAATKFSFWAKGGTVRDALLKVRVYYVNQVSASLNNAGKDSVYKEITVETGTPWTEYTIDLDSEKTYYGFAITFEKDSGEPTTDWVYIDDIMFYGRVNPWEK